MKKGARYRDFMDWRVPWYSALPSLDELLVGRTAGMMHIVSYLRDGDRVFETYWTTRRGVEAMDYSLSLMDLTVYGRQEPWERLPRRLAAGLGRRWLQHPDRRTADPAVVAAGSRTIGRPRRVIVGASI